MGGLLVKLLALSLARKIALGAGTVAVAATAIPALPTEEPKATATPQPKIEIKNVTETNPIVFTIQNIEDAALPKGQTKVNQEGINGETTITHEITYADGKETARKKLSEKVTKEPTAKIIATGTYVVPPPPPPTPPCDSNYSGCVPIASDVDCASGSGNGPAYARGPVRVIGTDIYDLDRDGNGIACE